MKNLFLTILLFATCTCIQTLSAQVTYHPKNPPTSEEKNLDSQVLTCIGETELFGKSFSFAEWTATLHYYTGKMLQRLSSEHVSKIAIEKKRVEALLTLVQNCEALKSIAPEMEDIHKIYQEEITYEEGTESTGLFEDDEVKASMDTGDVEELVKRLDKLRKKLNITRVIIRIL